MSPHHRQPPYGDVSGEYGAVRISALPARPLRRAAEVEAALYTMQEDLDVNFGPVYTVNVRRVFLETGDFHDVESLS